MEDYGNMVRQLMMHAQPVADKFNPLEKRLNPATGTEGVRGQGGSSIGMGKVYPYTVPSDVPGRSPRTYLEPGSFAVTGGGQKVKIIKTDGAYHLVEYPSGAVKSVPTYKLKY